MVESQLAFTGKLACQRSREYFMAQGAGWLTFLNRLQTPLKPVTVYDQMLVEFTSFMKEDRGLSPATVKSCCGSVRPSLIQLLDGSRSPETITVSDVDSLLALFRLGPSMSPVGSQHLQVVVEQLATESGNPSSS